MAWSDDVADIVAIVSKQPARVLSRNDLLPFWDVTNLNESSHEDDLLVTIQQARSRETVAPAVCVYPKWVPFTVQALSNTQTAVATVVNFPRGDASLQAIGIQIEQAIADGAREIDAVFPYAAFLSGDQETAAEFVAYCKSLCGKALLKVILETGAMQDPLLIMEAAKLSALAGADFIKTSTGKVPVGATFEAAALILLSILDVRKSCPQAIGLKVSGGIRTLSDASSYHQLASIMMGDTWMTPRHFRVGASKLE